MKLFNNAPSGMFLINSDLQIFKINKSALLQVDRNENEIIGDGGDDFFRYISIVEINKTCSHRGSCKTWHFSTLVQVALDNDRVFSKEEVELYVYIDGIEQKMNILLSTSVICIDDEKCVLVVFDDVTNERRLELELLKVTLATEEKERKRFAKDLHDDLGPLLAVLRLYFNLIVKSSSQEKKDEIEQNANEILDEAIKTLRAVSRNLSPHILENFGLIRALKSHVELISHESKIHINIRSSDDDIRMNEDIEINLYRVIKELINNSYKYSGTEKINISIEYYLDYIKIVYLDFGIGFDFEKYANSPSESRGITNISQRIKSINGKYKLRLKNKDVGFSIEIEVPLK